jgi:acetyl-CoA synthetase
MAEANIKWFVDAKVNITKIVLTDTLPKKGDKTAIILNRTTRRSITFPILNYTNAFVKWRMYCRNKEEKGDRLYLFTDDS